MDYHAQAAPRDIVRGSRESYNAYDGRYDVDARLEVDESSVRTAKLYIPEDDREDVFRASAPPMVQTASNGGCGASWSSPGRAYPYVNTEQVQPIVYGRDGSGDSSRSSSIGWAEHELYTSSRDWQSRQNDRQYHEETLEPHVLDNRYDHAYGAVGGQRRSKASEGRDANVSHGSDSMHRRV